MSDDLRERCKGDSPISNRHVHDHDPHGAPCLRTSPLDEDADGVDIRVLIESRLRWDAYVDASTLEVQVSGDTVSLIGVVRSANEMRRAEAIARTSAGMTVNTDALQVARWMSERTTPASDAPGASDATILSVIRSRLDADRQIAADNVNVQFSNGVATLRGSVDDLCSRSVAVGLVLSVSGVEIVKDRMLVLDSNRVASEKELARRAHSDNF